MLTIFCVLVSPLLPVCAFKACTGTNLLLRFMEIIAVCAQIHTKHINTLCGQNVEFVNVKLVVHTVTAGL